MSFPRRFSNVGVIGCIFTITIEFVYDLPRCEFCLVFAAEYVLKTCSRLENDRKTGLVEDAT